MRHRGAAPEGERRGQDGEPAQGTLLIWFEQVPAPADGCLDRLMAGNFPVATTQDGQARPTLAAISLTDSVRARAAASSIHSGMPSTARHNSTTAAAWPELNSISPPRAWLSRPVNNSTAPPR